MIEGGIPPSLRSGSLMQPGRNGETLPSVRASDDGVRPWLALAFVCHWHRQCFPRGEHGLSRWRTILLRILREFHRGPATFHKCGSLPVDGSASSATAGDAKIGSPELVARDDLSLARPVSRTTLVSSSRSTQYK